MGGRKTVMGGRRKVESRVRWVSLMSLRLRFLDIFYELFHFLLGHRFDPARRIMILPFIHFGGCLFFLFLLLACLAVPFLPHLGYLDLDKHGVYQLVDIYIPKFGGNEFGQLGQVLQLGTRANQGAHVKVEDKIRIG